MDRAHAPKRLVTVEGGGHIEALKPRFGVKYQEVLLDFFDTSLRGKYQGAGQDETSVP